MILGSLFYFFQILRNGEGERLRRLSMTSQVLFNFLEHLSKVGREFTHGLDFDFLVRENGFGEGFGLSELLQRIQRVHVGGQFVSSTTSCRSRGDIDSTRATCAARACEKRRSRRNDRTAHIVRGSAGGGDDDQDISQNGIAKLFFLSLGLLNEFIVVKFSFGDRSAFLRLFVAESETNHVIGFSQNFDVFRTSIDDIVGEGGGAQSEGGDHDSRQ